VKVVFAAHQLVPPGKGGYREKTAKLSGIFYQLPTCFGNIASTLVRRAGACWGQRDRIHVKLLPVLMA
jgi:hypothetical protein